jgi:hypothetical protein
MARAYDAAMATDPAATEIADRLAIRDVELRGY